MKMLCSGDLRHFVDIEYKSTATKDPYGNPLDVWNKLYEDVPAKIVSGNAAETWVGDAVQSQDAAVITTRYLDGVNETMRFCFRNRIFNILAISNEEERDVQLTFQCKEVIATAPAITRQTISGRAFITV
jgi:SPP1 family predicted phage head-tail adaptor